MNDSINLDIYLDRMTKLLNDDPNWNNQLGKTTKTNIQRWCQKIKHDFNNNQEFISDFADSTKLTMKNRRLVYKFLASSYNMKVYHQEYTDYELQLALCEVLDKNYNYNYKQITNMYGVSMSTMNRYILDCKRMVCLGMDDPTIVSLKKQQLCKLYHDNINFKLQWNQKALNIRRKTIGYPALNISRKTIGNP